MTTRNATRSELIDALRRAVTSKHVVETDDGWHRGAAVHSISADDLAGRDIVTDNVRASFNGRVLEYRGAYSVDVDLRTLEIG